jgi:predicted O-methyltransferase YrrM
MQASHINQQVLYSPPLTLHHSYMLACLNGSRSIVECGTSFGISTIYLALAVKRNTHGPRKDGCGVFTIEKMHSKVESAKKIWAEVGKDVEDWIHPYGGDILEVLKTDKSLPTTVDLLFLDGNVTFDSAFSAA